MCGTSTDFLLTPALQSVCIPGDVTRCVRKDDDDMKEEDKQVNEEQE